MNIVNTCTINGQEYVIPEITFEEICKLEENGIYLLNMDRNDRKVATMLRGLVAWIMDADPATASLAIQNHIVNGGDIGSILDSVSKALGDSGFFGQIRETPESKTPKLPQDHQRRRRKESIPATPKS